MKRLFSSLSILLVCACVLLMGACTKEGKHYPVSQEFKDYFLFQKGSYWIYKNDSTNEVDSTYLKTAPVYYSYLTGDRTKSDPSLEEYVVKFQSDILGRYLFYSSTGGQDFLEMAIGPSDNAYGMIDQLVPDSNYYLNFYPHGYLKVSPKIPSIEFNSKIFYNVLYTRYYSDSTTFNFYFAKNVGLIKIYGHWAKKDQSWSLLRYHVIH